MGAGITSARILLVGLGYAPVRGTGDKNFWLDLVRGLHAEGVDIAVLSINRRATAHDSQDVPGGEIEIRNMLPFALTRWHSDSWHLEPSFHRPPWSFAQRSLTLLRLLFAIERERDLRAKGHVHFMDNLGPLMRLARGRLGGTVSATAAAYQRSGHVYDSYLRASYGALDLVVAQSEALRARLAALGVNASRSCTVPWGVPATFAEGHAALNEYERAALGVLPGERVVLWTGFIQQVQEPDLRFALRAIEGFVQDMPRTRFVFVLKPEHYSPRYHELAPSGVRVLNSDRLDFLRLLATADVLFSPIEPRDIVVAPPLTWIEALAFGIPIVTTDVGGVRELLPQIAQSCIARGPHDMARAINQGLTLSAEPEARAVIASHIRQRYTIKSAVDGYVRAFRSLGHA